MRVCVVGSGARGRGLARALSSRGDEVALVSPRPVEMSLLWMRGDAVSGAGLRRGLEGASAAVYAAAGTTSRDIHPVGCVGAEQFARAGRRAGGGRLTTAGAAGAAPLAGVESAAGYAAAHRAGVAAIERLGVDVCSVALPALFGEDDHLLTPWLRRARGGKGVSARRPGLALRPLWSGDAVRALLAAIEGDLPDRISLQGPRQVTMEELASAVRARFRVGKGGPLGRVVSMGQSTSHWWRWLDEQAGATDDWTSLGLGRRVDPVAWIDRCRD